MNKRKSFNLFLVGLTGIVLCSTSCSKVKDLYNETDNGTGASSLLTDGGTVPSDFKWNSVKSVDVKVAVDDKFDGKYFYRVEIFDNDPSLSTGANLLAAGQAKLGQDFVGTMMVPTVAKYVYLRETSPLGTAAISMVEVGQSTTMNIGGVSTTSNKASVKRASTNGSVSNGGLRAATTSTTVTVPADAVEITGDANTIVSVQSNKSYVIKSGVTFAGKIDANNGSSQVKIYVQGTWKNTGYEFNLGGNNGLIVTQAGSLELANVTQNTNGKFDNYGAATLTRMETKNNSTYVNYGTLTVNTAEITNGSFTNYGVATIQTLSSTTNSTIVRNEGTLVVKDASFTNATLQAVCHTDIKSMKTNGAQINVDQGALLSIDVLDAGGTTINLAASAILDVNTLAKFNSQASKMQGPATGQALARLKKVDVNNQWMAITYSGNLQVACSDHTVNPQYQTFYVVNSPATIVPYDKSTVVIAGTACNAGGSDAAGGNPNNQTVTEVKLGTYSYAFEDNWPAPGDYDMNDFVVDMAITKYQNTANKITKVKLNVSLRSVGAMNRMAAAVQLDNVLATNIKSVNYSKQELIGKNIPLASNNVESGQKFAVLPICDDAHKAFGLSDVKFISTQDGSFKPVELTMTIDFNTPLDNFTYNNLNTFIITKGYSVNSRYEVHMAGYNASDKMNLQVVNVEMNQTKKLMMGDPFRLMNGDPWALCIPESFHYPNEYKKITGVYSKFQSWAQSGGLKDTDWYKKRNY